VLSALKADPELADLPVVMLSMVEDKNLGFAMGISDYLCKPVDRERLLTVVRRFRRECASGPVLVVDDDEVVRASVGQALAAGGYAVVEAEHGRAALDKLRATTPSLILLDLLMPEMDGFEFVEELRKNENWCSIPVVVVTAKDVTAEDRGRLRGSVQKVILKGTYTSEDLLAEVRALVERLGEQGTAVRS
jgi:CheY-like chemotaxis protein